MKERLAVVALGNPQSGKSTTWNRLFDIEDRGAAVKTGSYPRRLYLNPADWVEVFLVSGSPEERGVPLEDILPEVAPGVILCSVQYTEGSRTTFNYLLGAGYELYVVWLNPGFSDPGVCADTISLVSDLLLKGSTVWQCDARQDVSIRTQQIRQFLYGWVTVRNKLQTDYF